MPERSAAVVAGTAPPTRPEPDAISAAQDTVVGMDNAAPAVSVGFDVSGAGRHHRLRQWPGHSGDRRAILAKLVDVATRVEGARAALGMPLTGDPENLLEHAYAGANE